MRSPKTMVMVPVLAAGVYLSASLQVGLAQSCPLFGDPQALNSNATLEGGDDVSPQVATDSAGNWIAVWSSDDPLGGIGTDNDILFARSTDNGDTWTDVASLNTNADSDGDGADSAPQISTDSAGQWLAVWASTTNFDGIGTDQDILFAISANNGLTWSSPAPLNTNAGSDDGDDDAPQVSTDSSGNWVAVWESTTNLDGIGNDLDILVARSTNNGAGWSDPVALNTNAATDSGEDKFAQLTTDSGGNWVAVWESNENLDMMLGGDQDILFARSTNNGVSWTNPAALNTNAASDMGSDNNSDVTTDGGGAWVAVWQSQDDIGGIDTEPDILVALSADNGISWTDPAVLNTNAFSDVGFDFSPRVTTDGMGNWLAVWYSDDTLDGTIGNDFDCLSALSTDNGASWRSPVPLNTNADADSGNDRDPRLATDANGQWIAVWQSTDDLGGIGEDDDILAARFQVSTDDCDGNGVPDECDPDCDGDGIPDACEIADCPPNTPPCADCNNDAIPDECNIAECCSQGLPCCSQDCQPDEVPDECQTSGMVVVSWAGGVGNWSAGAQWCPDLTPTFPDNDADNSYEVSISGPDALLTLDVSPAVSALFLADAATLEVNDGSEASVRTLAVEGTLVNDAVCRATDRERLVLAAPVIDQGMVCGVGGILEASDGALGEGEAGDVSILEINGAVVLGGTARSVGENSQIHVVGGAELVDVCVEGVVVPDGQAGAFSGTIVNDGVLLVAPQGLSLTFFSPTAEGGILAGNGGDDDCVCLGGESAARLGDFKSTFTNAGNHRVEGAGVIFGGMINQGMVRADVPSAALILFPPGDKQNDGVLQAADVGTLRISDTVVQSSSARIEARAGGTVEILETVEGTGGLLADGGTVNINQTMTAFGECIEILSPDSLLRITGASLSALTPGSSNDLAIRGGTVDLIEGAQVTLAGPLQVCWESLSPDATLSIDAVSLLLAGDLQIGHCGILDIAGGVTVSAALDFVGTVEANWNWPAGSSLAMAGSVGLPDDDPTGYAGLEIGGVDLGIDPDGHVGDPDGFVDNFDLAALIIGEDAHISLQDVRDNGNRNGPFGAAEALYVDVLTFADTAGRLNLNGLNLYFNTLNGSGDQIIDLAGCAGDFDGSGGVDAADLADVLGSWGACLDPCPPYCPTDLTADCDVGPADLAALLGNWGACN